MNSTEHKIRSEANRLGFSHCGFAEVRALEELRPFYDQYLEKNRTNPFTYIEKHRDKRLDPRLLVEGARSVIAVSLNYFPENLIPEEDNFIIAKYAVDGDHYGVIRERLHALGWMLQETYGARVTRVFVDSGPVLEKYWARRCGIGWIGKHSLLINRETGSYTQIGVLFTDLILQPDTPETDHCGSCTRCVQACPTKALETPYVLDILRCIAFQTIENRNAIPDEIKTELNGRIFGCDICQDVCPYNQSAKANETRFFRSNDLLHSFRKEDWLNLTEAQFRELFEGTPVKRRGFHLFSRNVSDACGS